MDRDHLTARIMEAQSGAEVRQLHVVYFLSRKGFTEHPHLIRVHHHSNTGVRLHDIKKWLGELRGTHMPESFAWSYKRRYKTGYIWQDLLDDDLVTPVSDNEFVLKGSEISPTTNNAAGSDQETPIQKDQYSSSETSTPLSSIIKELSTLTNVDSNKNREAKNNKKTDGRTICTSGVASSDKPRSTMSFRNFITCGGVDTKDSAVLTTYGKLASSRLGKAPRSTRNLCNKGRSSRDGAYEPTKRKAQRREDRGVNYKPLNGPNCAQCGKGFKPEKLHSHMKSCKGTKNFASSHASFSCVAENKSQISSAASRNRGSNFLSVFPK